MTKLAVEPLPISAARRKGKPLTPEADALALRVAKMVAKARGTHDDKFTALVAVIAALGVADEMYLEDTGPRTNAPGQNVCELNR